MKTQYFDFFKFFGVCLAAAAISPAAMADDFGIRANAEVSAVHEVDTGSGGAGRVEVEVGQGSEIGADDGLLIFKGKAGASVEGRILDTGDGDTHLQQGEAAVSFPGAEVKLIDVFGLKMDTEAYFGKDDSLGVDLEGGLRTAVELNFYDLGHTLLKVDARGPVRLEAKVGASGTVGVRERNDDTRGFLRLGLTGGLGLCLASGESRQKLCLRGKATGEAGIVETRVSAGASLDYEAVISDGDRSPRSILYISAGTESVEHTDPTGTDSYTLNSVSAGIGF